MTNISGSVGQGARNLPQDVGTVQALLNRHVGRLGLPPLKIDKQAGPKTVAAIQAFQRRVMQLHLADGRVEPNSRTLLALSGAHAADPFAAAKLSGSAWWNANQAKYPNSKSIADLASPFRENVTAFVGALQAAGASVTVGSTLRNKKRAYLMHYSWNVANGLTRPSDVPVEPGVDIVWDHGDLSKSRAAAQEMVNLFEIRYQPSLRSLHLSGQAIDMDVEWSGTLNIKKKNGQTIAVDEPRNGAANTTLHAVGATYSVIKLLSDPPHWSYNGH